MNKEEICMADFKQAAQWMNEGKKVKRKNVDNFYLELSLNRIRYRFVNGNELLPDQYMRPTELDALDWEIFPKEEDWSWFSHAPSSGGIMNGDLIKEDLVTLKEKIKSDLEDQGHGKFTIWKILDKRFGF